MLDHRREDLEGDQDAGGLPAPDVVGRFLLEERADFGQLVGARGAIVEQVRQLRAVRVEVGGGILGQARVALEDQQLVFRARLLSDAVEVAREVRGRHPDELRLAAAHGLRVVVEHVVAVSRGFDVVVRLFGCLGAGNVFIGV